MNETPDPASRLSAETPPANWREAAADLVSARLALVELEARDAAKGIARKGLAGGVLAAAAFFTWALLLAGAIPLVAKTAGISWEWIALIAAGIHLLAGIICLVILKKPSPPAFTHTRSEFQRDREWFKSL